MAFLCLSLASFEGHGVVFCYEHTATSNLESNFFFVNAKFRCSDVSIQFYVEVNSSELRSTSGSSPIVDIITAVA